MGDGEVRSDEKAGLRLTTSRAGSRQPECMYICIPGFAQPWSWCVSASVSLNVLNLATQDPTTRIPITRVPPCGAEQTKQQPGPGLVS